MFVLRSRRHFLESFEWEGPARVDDRGLLRLLAVTVARAAVGRGPFTCQTPSVLFGYDDYSPQGYMFFVCSNNAAGRL
ncbi:hypothetical protein J6590_000181 [Homalodisca vitripennis]|nr:hypothetical protein J6590_000181 [Homalodisca vitripennis]